jgi:hypothetical protein
MKTLHGLISQAPDDYFLSMLAVAGSLGPAAGKESLEDPCQFVIRDTSHPHKK